MNVLFLHNNYPGQFINLINLLTQSDQGDIYFISKFGRNDLQNSKVKCITTKHGFTIDDKFKNQLPLLDNINNAEIFAYEMIALKNKGFYPDVIYDHPGWGCGMYAPEVFPDAARICHFEWFYNKKTLHTFFSKDKSKASDGFALNRQRNLYQLDALMECDVAITPTAWQLKQYPPEFYFKFHVIHDGINTDFFAPKIETPNSSGMPTVQGVDLASYEEVVTYTARGMEPYRGFPQFYKSIPKILKARPKCHVVIMANDTVHYSEPRIDGKGWGQAMREEIAVDNSRVHFLNYGSYPEYLAVLQSSSVHVYLTAPFVLSWSLLEAMSCGCLLVGSKTEPVTEVITHGENGYLADFWDEDNIANVVTECLENKAKLLSVRKNARQTILERYDGKKMVPQRYFAMQEAWGRKKFHGG